MLNCSTGPIGPLSIRNQYHKFPPLFHENVYSNNYEDSNSKTTNGKKNGRLDQGVVSKSNWKSSTLSPSSPRNVDHQKKNWQRKTSTAKKTAADLIAVSRDLRQALNRRCSGMANGRMCSFNLHIDYEESQIWGSGLVDIFYRCIPKKDIETTCTSSSSPSSSSDSYSSYSRTYKVNFPETNLGCIICLKRVK